MLKKIFHSLMFWIFNLLIIGLIVFIVNSIYDLDINSKIKDEIQKKLPPRRRRIRPRLYLEEEWFSPEEKKPPFKVPIVVELKENKFFNFVKIEIQEGDYIGHIKKWRYLTKEELLLETQISLSKGKKINLW